MKKSISRAVRFGCGLLGAGATMIAATTSGDVEEVASDVVHPNGNTYDQMLLRGAIGTMQADPGQVARLSFIDLTDDIVQVEFSGNGSLTVSLENASGPMAPAKYDQPGVEYMRGHASIRITGGDATTNVSVFSVGRINAVNQAIFRSGVTYDGFADIARIEIVAGQNGPAAFGGIRAGNARFFATEDFTGIFAGGVQVQGPVIVGDVSAYDNAEPLLWFGDNSPFGSLSVAGGSLFQPNGRPLQTYGIRSIFMVNGTSSIGVALSSQRVGGRVEHNGLDVTDAIVLYPATAVAIGGASTTITPFGTNASVSIAIAAATAATGAAAATGTTSGSTGGTNGVISVAIGVGAGSASGAAANPGIVAPVTPIDPPQSGSGGG